MATASIYYRTLSTLSDTAGATTPAELLANHPTQVLEFDIPDNILEAIRWDYQNNIINIPSPNSDGVRKINKQENGLRSNAYTINGVFRNPKLINADIAKLRTFASLKQLDDKHIYGTVGFYSPNAPEFSIDPNATAGTLPAGKATIGLTIDGFTLRYAGQQPTRYDFQVMVSFGGIFTG